MATDGTDADRLEDALASTRISIRIFFELFRTIRNAVPECKWPDIQMEKTG